MGVYESHMIVMDDGKKLDISLERYEIIVALLNQQPKPETLQLGSNIIFTRHIIAIREKGTWTE